MLKKPSKKKETPGELVRKRAYARMAAGESRQAVALSLLAKKDYLHEKYLEQFQALHTIAHELSLVMANRNIDGMKLEEIGEIDEAILLYEQNIADQSKGSHSYERLGIIYTKREDYANAIRVCQAAVECPFMDGQKREEFQKLLVDCQSKAEQD